MKDNNFEAVVKLRVKINRARAYLLFMIILTLVNVLIYINDGMRAMPFSSAIATFSVILGKNISTPFYIGGIAIAAVLISFLSVCYFKSKNNAVFAVAAFAVVAVDFITLIIMTFTPFFSDGAVSLSLTLLDAAAHLILLVFLYNAINVYRPLQKLSAQCNDDDENAEAVNPENENIKNESDYEKYFDDGTEPLVSREYGELYIFVVFKNERAELVVNDIVCDVLESPHNDEFSLRAIVNETNIFFQYKRNHGNETMCLYADGKLIDRYIKEN